MTAELLRNRCRSLQEPERTGCRASYVSGVCEVARALRPLRTVLTLPDGDATYLRNRLWRNLLTRTLTRFLVASLFFATLMTPAAPAYAGDNDQDRIASAAKPDGNGNQKTAPEFDESAGLNIPDPLPFVTAQISGVTTDVVAAGTHHIRIGESCTVPGATVTGSTVSVVGITSVVVLP